MGLNFRHFDTPKSAFHSKALSLKPRTYRVNITPHPSTIGSILDFTDYINQIELLTVTKTSQGNILGNETPTVHNTVISDDFDSNYQKLRWQCDTWRKVGDLFRLILQFLSPLSLV